MKRVLALVLALLMVVPFVACGDEKDFNVSKEVFTRVHDAAEKIDAMASDIYEAWRIGIDCNMESLKYVDDLSFLTNNMSIDEDDIYGGLVDIEFHYDDYVKATEITKDDILGYDIDNYNDYKKFLRDCQRDWLSSKFEEFEEFEEIAPIYEFVSMHGDSRSGLVRLIINTYEEGIFDISSNLDYAEKDMKTLSNNYEHYQNLKDYFTTVKAFYDYCQNPTGSFEQAASTIEDYRNKIRDYYYKLEYVFGE